MLPQHFDDYAASKRKEFEDAKKKRDQIEAERLAKIARQRAIEDAEATAAKYNTTKGNYDPN